MNNRGKSLTSLLHRSTLSAERSTFSAKFFPNWATSSSYQLDEKRTAADAVYGDPSSWSIDTDVSYKLSQVKTINWLRTGIQLHPIRHNTRPVRGDSIVSLLIAVSTVLWAHLGVCDDHLITYLKEVLLDNVRSNSNDDSQLAERWKLHSDLIATTADLTLSPSTPWADVWSEDVVSLQAIHIFTLSQTICRPIIVISSDPPTSDADHLAGIYLPLLQPLSSCCRYPVVIALDSQSAGFLPLVTAQSSPSSSSEMVVPLCNYDLQPLEVRCVLETERPDCLLETYLRVTEVPCMREDGVTLVPTARLDTQTAPSIDELWNMLPGNDNAPADDDLPRCTSLGCRYYGLIAYAGRCYQCHKSQSTTTTTPVSPQTRLMTAEHLLITDEDQHKYNEYRTLAVEEHVLERCVNPSCEEQGSQNYNGFCPACYIDPGRHCTPALNRQPHQLLSASPGSPHSWNEVRLNDMERRLHNERRVTFAQEPIPVHTRSRHRTEEENNVGRERRCVTEGCPSFASRGSVVCANCETLQKLELKRLEESRHHPHHPHHLEHQQSQPQQPCCSPQRAGVYCTGPRPLSVPRYFHVEQGSQANHQVARPCVSGHCDRYGDSNFAGFCSVCYGYRR